MPLLKWKKENLSKDVCFHPEAAFTKTKMQFHSSETLVHHKNANKLPVTGFFYFLSCLLLFCCCCCIIAKQTGLQFWSPDGFFPYSRTTLLDAVLLPKCLAETTSTVFSHLSSLGAPILMMRWEVSIFNKCLLANIVHMWIILSCDTKSYIASTLYFNFPIAKPYTQMKQVIIHSTMLALTF